jgi:hypothetical protein
VSDYEHHLIRLFFAYLHAPVFPLFEEHTFFNKLHPVNRHPSFLIDAICGISALFSTHAETNSVHGGSEKAAAFFLSRANLGLEKIETSRQEMDCLQAVQALTLIAIMQFGWDQPFSAYKSINAAIRMAVRLKVDREDPNFAINPLSIWQVPQSVYNNAQLEERRRVWSMCVFLDTCSGTLSGFPLTIEESMYPYLLLPRRPVPETSGAGGSSQNSSPAGSTEKSPLYLSCLTHPPTETIFHQCRPSLIPPKASSFSEEGWVALMQICFILRKIVRTNCMTRLQSRGMGYHSGPSKSTNGQNGEGDKSGTEARATITKTLFTPMLAEARDLHDALTNWYEGLPSNLKPFASLMFFRKKSDLPDVVMPGLPLNQNEDTTDDVQQNLSPTFDKNDPLAVMLASLYLTALATLHLPRAGAEDNQQGPLNRLESWPGRSPNLPDEKATSMEVVVLARRAQMALLVSLMPHLAPGGTNQPGNAAPSSGKDDSDGVCLEETPELPSGCGTNIQLPLSRISRAFEIFSSSNPPPPYSISSNPFHSFHIFTLAAASLAVSGFATDLQGKLSDKRAHEAKDTERSVVKVNIPVVDRLAKVWPVAGVYSNRLRRVVKAVRAKYGEGVTGGKQK